MTHAIPIKMGQSIGPHLDFITSDEPAICIEGRVYSGNTLILAALRDFWLPGRRSLIIDPGWDLLDSLHTLMGSFGILPEGDRFWKSPAGGVLQWCGEPRTASVDGVDVWDCIVVARVERLGELDMDHIVRRLGLNGRLRTAMDKSHMDFVCGRKLRWDIAPASSDAIDVPTIIEIPQRRSMTKGDILRAALVECGIHVGLNKAPYERAADLFEAFASSRPPTDVVDWASMIEDLVRRGASIDRDNLLSMCRVIIGQAQQIVTLLDERDEARGWARRLTSEARVLTCAFCGEAYPPGTPTSNHNALTAHVLVCAKHPMREVEKERDELRKKLSSTSLPVENKDVVDWPKLPQTNGWQQGQRIRFHRQAAGISLDQVVAYLGTALQHVINIERGLVEPTHAQVRKLAALFNVDEKAIEK